MKLEDALEEALKRRDALALEAEPDLALRYRLRRPSWRVGPRRRLRLLVAGLLRWLRPGDTRPWLPGLVAPGTRPLLILALGIERDRLRDACRGIEALRGRLPGFAPVLLTDVADFAYFSRLGWLVEYLPNLGPPAARYRERKLRYLAWRYREAPVLPAEAGLAVKSQADTIGRWVLRRSGAVRP